MKAAINFSQLKLDHIYSLSSKTRFYKIWQAKLSITQSIMATSP